MSEADLGRQVVAWLEEQHWDVYQEVEILHCGIADIVAVQQDARPKRIWIIETKLSLTFEVIAQATRWRPFAHYVSCAVPTMKNARVASAGRRLAREVCSWKGIGLIEVRPPEKRRMFASSVDTEIEPELHRTRHPGARQLPSTVLALLRPEHKRFATAGSPRGGYWTPFKQTCAAIKALVEAKPGVVFQDVLESTPTHYRTAATARSSLLKWGQQGKVEGVLFHFVSKKWCLYPDTAEWRSQLKIEGEAG